jgi:hypothetical protein
LTDEELFGEWGAAWTLHDVVEKERRLRGCCTADVEFIPPENERLAVRGIDDLVQHMLSYTADWPANSSVRLARPPETHHGWSRGLMLWSRPPRLNQGTDIIRVSDGKIAVMLVFADPSPTP